MKLIKLLYKMMNFNFKFKKLPINKRKFYKIRWIYKIKKYSFNYNSKSKFIQLNY